MGGGTTDICIYRNETLIYSAVIPAGGEHYTNDIAYCLQLDLETAEKLKKDFKKDLLSNCYHFFNIIKVIVLKLNKKT